MQAYLALLWNEKDARASATAKALLACPGLETNQPRSRTVAAGLAVVDLSGRYSDYEFISLGTDPNHQGVIVGPLFRRAKTACGSGPVTSVDTAIARQIFRSGGKALIGDFWGSYVGFLTTPDKAFVIADPTSALPCFYTTHKGVTLVFSHLEKCPVLDELPLTLNECFLSQMLIKDKVQTGQTGLMEVHELGGGMRLTISDEGLATDLLWDASQVAQCWTAPAADEATAELRDTIRSVVLARASQFRRISISLSGGLDSAIVLACLAEGCGAKLNAVHQYSNSGDPLEIHYAREVAETIGCELKLVEIAANRCLPTPDRHPLTARPNRAFVSPDIAELISEDSGFLGEALFTGEGGDHLFHHSKTPLIFADHLINTGISRTTLHQLLCGARLSEQSIWQVIYKSLPYIFAHDKKGESSLSGPAPAKAEQVGRLSHMLHVREVFDHSQARRTVHPLISQPLVELCLSLPTYLLALNGINRGLAREAFRGIIPERIRTRMSKGNATRHAIALISANRDLIGASLLDGELVQRGLLDRASIEDFLREDGYRYRELGRRMLVYYAVEAWLSRWTGYLRSRAVAR